MNAITGTWNAVVHTFMGDQFSTHTLDAENGLTGQIKDGQTGNVVDIYETSIDGNKISYKFTVKIPIGEMEFTITAELVDGKLVGQSVNAMGEFGFEATKA